MCFEIWVNLSIKNTRFYDVVLIFYICFALIFGDCGMLFIRSESNAPINNHMT